MSFLDELAFGPGRDWRAWIRWILLTLALLALAAAILYFTVAGDYAFLKAAVYTGSPTGEYHAVGERLAARALKNNGHLNVVVTAGPVENIKRLAGENGQCEPGFAFVQDGVPLPDDAGFQTLGRLPQPVSLLLLARRGRAIASFADLRGASVGIGPEGSGTGFLMQHLLENSDLKELGLSRRIMDFEAQAALVQANQLDLAAFVMNENAELIRNLVRNTTSRSYRRPESTASRRGTAGCTSARFQPVTTTSPDKFPRLTRTSRRSTRSSSPTPASGARSGSPS